MKKIFKHIVILLALFIITWCGNSRSTIFDGADNAPYAVFYEVDRMNTSSSYSYSNGKNSFNASLNWVSKDENIDYATLTDEFYLEYAFEELSPYELIESNKDMSSLKDKTYTISPGEKLELSFDVDAYYDELYEGYYRIVKILNVYYKDKTSRQEVVSFSYDLNI